MTRQTAHEIARALSALLVVLLLGLLAGCQSWHGPAEVRLRNGQRIQCPDGLRMDKDTLYCVGSGVSVRWEQVAGYEAR